MIKEILRLLSKDNLQVQALSECYEMLDLCDAMVRASVDSLRNRDDAKVAIDLLSMDKKINSFERDVRRKVMTHLSLGNTGDIAEGLRLVSIVIDIERIGDYSKNINELASYHPTRFHAGPAEDRLKKVETSALGLFDRTLKAFKQGDLDAARKVMVDYKEDVSKGTRELERDLVQGKIELAASEAVTLALYLRFLKRISAHSRNLISSLVNPLDRIGYPE